MDDSARKRQLASVLRDVASGATSAQNALEVISKWNEVHWKEAEFSRAFQVLSHFDADSDIRMANRKYAEAQLELLRQQALQLEND